MKVVFRFVKSLSGPPEPGASREARADSATRLATSADRRACGAPASGGK